MPPSSSTSFDQVSSFGLDARYRYDAALALPLADDEFVQTVAVEIAGNDGVTVGNHVVDDVPLPRIVLSSR